MNAWCCRGLLASFMVWSGVFGAELRPNIVLVVADDLRWDTVGFAGNRLLQTPHLDRLARRGTVFTNAFVTTAICCVSRASLFSGCYERAHGITNFAKPFRPEQWRHTYPARLRQAGYRTGFIGKFGVGDAAAVKRMAAEFDVWHGLPGQGGLFIDPATPGGPHATARFGSQSVEFINSSVADRPFCLSISFTAPHARDGRPREFTPDARDETLYSDLRIPAPPTATEAFFQLLPEAIKTSEGRKRWERRFATDEMRLGTVRDYYRLVTGMDREVGRLIEALEQRRQLTNTVLIFTSDNGFALGDRGLAGKWFMYEESIRVPLFVVDLRPAGSGSVARSGERTVGALALNVDVAPTILDYAGVPSDGIAQGVSLRPWVEGVSPSRWRRDFFYEHHFGPDIIPSCEGVRGERWKYARYLGSNPPVEQLFDLIEDPLEARNLVEEPSHRERLDELRARWTELGGELSRGGH